MKPTTAKISFILYSFITGLTFSSIFVVFNLSSIMLVFLVTAILFGLFSLIGYFTNIDLSKFGTFLFMALIGIIICTIINMILGNSTFDLIITLISIIVFLGYTSYDINKIKKLSNVITEEDNLAIIGALELYLDFINLFIDLLKILGRSSRD